LFVRPGDHPSGERFYHAKHVDPRKGGDTTQEGFAKKDRILKRSKSHRTSTFSEGSVSSKPQQRKGEVYKTKSDGLSDLKNSKGFLIKSAPAVEKTQSGIRYIMRTQKDVQKTWRRWGGKGGKAISKI